MNKYVRDLFGTIFQNWQTQHVPQSPEEWRQHWQNQGWPWRTEPEIEVKRRVELAQRRAVIPSIEQGIYPFKGVNLNRADVEWLLATHENGRGPVDWSDESQRKRQGLDLRGANVSGENLSNLPLAGLVGGLTQKERKTATKDQCNAAAVVMEETISENLHLEGSCLAMGKFQQALVLNAFLDEAYLVAAEFEKATLYGSCLEASDLSQANLLEAKCHGANFRKAKLIDANLQGALFLEAHFENAVLSRANLEGASLGYYVEEDYEHPFLEEPSIAVRQQSKAFGAHLEDAYLFRAILRNADLSGAYLKGAVLGEACLEGAFVRRTDLEGAFFGGAKLKGVDLREANLRGAELTNVVLDDDGIGPRLADANWDDVNLAVVKWTKVKMLGDEHEARQKVSNGQLKSKKRRLEEYKSAVRANRQLAIALENQGLNEDATRFAHRACKLQRKVYWKQRNFWRYLGSAMLALLAGYGYQMWRIIIAYATVILLCAGAYYVLGMQNKPPLSFLSAILTSVTAFHGRVFSEPLTQPGILWLWVTAAEAVVGFIIEGVFIAMLTQKFFGK